MNQSTSENREQHILELSQAGIREHQIVKRIPYEADEDPRFLALCADIEENGIRQPLLMTSRHEIVDVGSRSRWKAAKRVGCEEIPAIYVADDQVHAAFLTGLVLQRHFTKSALAYLAFPTLQGAHEEARRRQLEKRIKSNVFRSSSQSTTGQTVEEFASNLGFCRNLFFQAKQVHEIFARDAEYKATMEPRILAEPIGGEHEDRRPVGLGAVIAGWGGRASTKDQAKPSYGQLDLFTEGFGTFVRRFTYWSGFDEAARRKARQQMRSEIAGLPPEQCGAMAEFMGELAKELRERAKE